MRTFDSLTEQEILALAISMEDEDSKIYADFAAGLKDDFPATAKLFEEMEKTEILHKARLTKMFQERFGEHIPHLRREWIKGFADRRPVWLFRPLRLEVVRRQAAIMEAEATRFYEKSAERATDPGVKELLLKLAEEERAHEHKAHALEERILTDQAKEEEAEIQRRLFVLQVVQPGLAGLMDGSVSTLAPLFAAAFATHNSWDAFLVGLAASIGAGISMGFAEALSDDGSLTGRGRPWLRGTICGLMTAVGGLGHTLPYLIPAFWPATAVAVAVVIVELFAISWIRAKYMDSTFTSAAWQVVLGGLLVFLSGVLIGSS